MARLGFQVKKLIGGLDWWHRDGYAMKVKTHPQGKLFHAVVNVFS